METVYIILKVSALLAIIVVPLIGPKKEKKQKVEGISGLSVNEGGYLEYYNADDIRYTKVN